MAKSEYTPISGEGDEVDHGASRFSRPAMLLVMAVVATLSLVVWRAAGSSTEVPLEGMSLARPCTFKECFASNCNHEAAPYTCLFHNGGPHGGW